MRETMNKLLQIPCEIYSRVVGYYRPVNQWNKGKQAEFEDRVEADVKNIDLEKINPV
jgi:anaerobic ribonucleoside-triphosphate reductase